jgi:hypothetical protein
MVEDSWACSKIWVKLSIDQCFRKKRFPGMAQD